jgi:phenylacetate-CoA ligase
MKGEGMFQPGDEARPRPELESLQSERLVALVNRVTEAVPLYRAKYADAGFDPASLRGLEDLHRIPFTVKDDLRSAYPYGMFAVPRADIVRVHASSGTTGQITVVGYTRGDIDMWADMMARTFAGAGATPDDVIQVAYGYGLFTGGLGAHYGAERLGSLTVPISGGNTARQVQIMKDFGVTILACTPSYALHIAEAAVDSGVDPRELPLRAGVFGAEPWSDAMRTQLQDALGAKAFDIYGLSEVLGPGVAFECECQDGLHVNEDHFYVEILDPDTLEPVPEGTWGEVVFTTLTKEGIPVVRYRTRDLSRIVPGPCACGRTLRRIQRITGRTDDMIIVRGVNVFPSQIEQILAGFPGVAPHYQVVLTKDGPMDAVEVRVEVSPDIAFDEIKVLEKLQADVRQAINSALAINVRVKMVEPRSIQRSEGKAVRVIDLRKEGQA